MIVTRPEQISDLLDVVHDLWFDVERIKFDPEEKVVQIRLERDQKKLESGSNETVILKIRNASQLLVNDTEKVGYYDLNEVKYQNGRVIITAGIPIDIQVEVGAFEIEVPDNR